MSAFTFPTNMHGNFVPLTTYIFLDHSLLACSTGHSLSPLRINDVATSARSLFLSQARNIVARLLLLPLLGEQDKGHLSGFHPLAKIPSFAFCLFHSFGIAGIFRARPLQKSSFFCSTCQRRFDRLLKTTISRLRKPEQKKINKQPQQKPVSHPGSSRSEFQMSDQQEAQREIREKGLENWAWTWAHTCHHSMGREHPAAAAKGARCTMRKVDNQLNGIGAVFNSKQPPLSVTENAIAPSAKSFVTSYACLATCYRMRGWISATNCLSSLLGLFSSFRSGEVQDVSGLCCLF